jgi:hypothetical protein
VTCEAVLLGDQICYASHPPRTRTLYKFALNSSPAGRSNTINVGIIMKASAEERERLTCVGAILAFRQPPANDSSCGHNSCDKFSG